MSKRKILAAAKKRGITIVSANYDWIPNPGEMVPQWTIEFGPELDDEICDFANAAEAVEFIETAEMQGTQAHNTELSRPATAGHKRQRDREAGSA